MDRQTAVAPVLPHYPLTNCGPALELLGVEAAQVLCESEATWVWRHWVGAHTQVLIPIQPRQNQRLTDLLGD